MKQLFFSLLVILFSNSAFAKEMKCQIDEAVQDGAPKMNIPVTVISGFINKGDLESVTRYEGSTISVQYFKGSNFETQTYLRIEFDDMVSTIYDVSEKSLYMLEKGDLRLQCRLK